jgi:hypothetical protein
MNLHKLTRTQDWRGLSYYERRYLLCHHVLPKRFSRPISNLVWAINKYGRITQQYTFRFQTPFGTIIKFWDQPNPETELD